MDDAALARNLVLAWPLALVVVATAVRQARTGDVLTRAPAAFLAALWVWVTVHVVEVTTSWWTFAPSSTSLLGVPAEVSLGWALLWGALPVLAGGPLWAWVAGLAWVDLLTMRLADDLVALAPGWVAGEAILLGAGLVPALILGKATRERTWLPVRAGLQVVLFPAVFGWLVPTVALARDGLTWMSVVDHPYPMRALLLTAAVGLGVPGLAAVAELARAGGTPFPWDPPAHLVTSGPYAYVSNPMQISIAGLMTLLTAATGSLVLAGLTAFSVAFSVVLAERHERATLSARWPAHDDYRRHVRSWVPRWRPWVAAPATLWVSEACALCSATGVVLDSLAPTGLERRPAEAAPVALVRMRWQAGDPPDSDHSDGIAAFARALEHTTLPWAWLGWCMRLPVVRPWLQVVADACGLGPRPLVRTGADDRMRP
ncbi:isoprenylcysteine carboxylmethyltransferase family protein [Nocardioides seonyuensis]|uniref:Isoprenylcysteine carboxylmethyltransferase family protein n=1 Tax=Nocardioides seonyuensis TaxID=2518371 RepID=A0A4P7IIJ5_9ACTN|nr:methyltransferase [Nocardioides seonyuensis]QBX55701.1 isoprenylcysteine carboxylmethyltransferase family protein [Nocardioides seonyuensis]